MFILMTMKMLRPKEGYGRERANQPAFVSSLFSRISTLSLAGFVCFPAIELIKVALLLPATFVKGENRPWTSTSEFFNKINSAWPLKVKDKPSNDVRCGSPRAPPCSEKRLKNYKLHTRKHL